jgi:hypothetical protein
MLVLVEAIQKTWAMQHENVSKNFPGSTSTARHIAAGVADLGGKCLPSETHAAAIINSAGSLNSKNRTADVLLEEGITAATRRTSVCVCGEPAGYSPYQHSPAGGSDRSQTSNPAAELPSNPASFSNAYQPSKAAADASFSNTKAIEAHSDGARKAPSHDRHFPQQGLSNNCGQAMVTKAAIPAAVYPDLNPGKGNTGSMSLQQENFVDASIASCKAWAPAQEKVANTESSNNDAANVDQSQTRLHAPYYHARSSSPTGVRVQTETVPLSVGERITCEDHQTRSRKGAGALTPALSRRRSMSAPGGKATISTMLKGSEPDERSVRSWLTHIGVKVKSSRTLPVVIVVEDLF